MQRPIIKSEEFFQVKTVQIQNSTKQKLQILNPVLLIAAWARFLDRHLSNPDTSSPVQSYSLWKGSYHETAVHSLGSNHHCFQIGRASCRERAFIGVADGGVIY